MNEDHLARFQKSFNEQDFPQAFAVCSEAINEDANDWNALYLAGTSLRNLGKTSDALEFYARALNLNRDSAHIWVAAGIALQNLSRYPEAIDALNRALKIEPDLYGAHNSLGLTYNLAGDNESAMRAYYDALQVRVNLAFAEVRSSHPNLFRIEQRGSEKIMVIHPSCSERTRDILVTDFNYFNTLRNMITCCLEMGDHAKARELQAHVDNCTPIDPDIIGPINPSGPPKSP